MTPSHAAHAWFGGLKTAPKSANTAAMADSTPTRFAVVHFVDFDPSATDAS
ncbi:MAG: hypothetical protein QM728_04525 [Gordonia sp. (in: high G+C Gram-positive bacteria)]|uniref:hypothetical protein n=1 Tax=Gordonia sp. (in: high G+C Gram-positive bacteria) TaxID=84139 RepID=UPI0039E3F64B